MRGDQHAADGVDEGADPVAAKLRAQGVAQCRQVTAVAQLWQRPALFDGNADLSLGSGGVQVTRHLPLAGVAQVQLVHQQVQALQVVAHGQRRHAVDTGLEQLAGLAVAELVDDVLALLLGAGAQADQCACQQQAREEYGFACNHRHRVEIGGRAGDRRGLAKHRARKPEKVRWRGYRKSVHLLAGLLRSTRLAPMKALQPAITWRGAASAPLERAVPDHHTPPHSRRAVPNCHPKR
ncbi:hypothetical protein D3C78_471630 [compost metagenome]